MFASGAGSGTFHVVATNNGSELSPGGIVAVFNPASGGSLDEEALRAILGPEAELVPTTEDDPGIGQARDAVANGADTVVACGGDGTVRACIEGMVQGESGGRAAEDARQVPLAIIPTGTGNLLASNLGIGDDPDQSKTIADGDLLTIDVGRANGEPFAVMAGSGFDALMIRDADSKTKERLGVVAYVISAVRNLRTRLIPTTVTVDDQEWFNGRTVMVLVGNFGSITGGVEVFPDADPADGRLDVGVVAASRMIDWLSVGYRLVRRLPQNPDLVRRTQGTSIVIRTSERRPYEIDGEERPATDRIEISVEPKALTVRTAPDPS